MAFIFELAAECGTDSTAALELVECFEGATWTLSDGTIVEYRSKPSDVGRGSDGAWWCSVAPSGISATGEIPTVKNVAPRIEVARALYARLQECRGYRFASVGWEVSGMLSLDEIMKAKDDLAILPAGLAIGRDLYGRLGAPSLFVPFGTNGFWKRPSEEDYAQMVRLFQDDT